MPDFFDAHTHVQFSAYDNDRDAVLSRAREAGVKMIAVGTDFGTSEAATRLTEENPGEIWATAGFHPSHLASDWYHDTKEKARAVQEQFSPERLGALAARPEVVAIGECGLDYYRLNAESGIVKKEKDKQREVFLSQAELAQKLNKPLMIHARPSKGTDDSYEDVLSLIPDSRFTIPKISHFYVGSLAVTAKLVDAGFYFTFGGVITFSRDYDEVIRFIPTERILSETDAPYVAPLPYRGKRNEPAYVVETVKTLAVLKGLGVDEMSEKILENAKRIFSL